MHLCRPHSYVISLPVLSPTSNLEIQHADMCITSIVSNAHRVPGLVSRPMCTVVYHEHGGRVPFKWQSIIKVKGQVVDL